MRCKNCGWENPDNLTNCEKCNTFLGDTVPSNTSRQYVSDEMKKTVAEGVVFNDTGFAPKTCPRCGYPLGDGAKSCPNCNYELQSSQVKDRTLTCKSCGAENAADARYCSYCGESLTKGGRQIRRPSMGGTVMGGPISDSPAGKTFCTLRPIVWEGEERNYEPVTYSGEVIVLSRSNTDANNNSITSNEQAVLTHKDGEWYIENRSDLRSTFIRVNGQVKLNNGDIIVLGNREFEFKG
ncbi:MAG: zinc ribbon domain-containing protein [Bacteroidales bacterium]|nr:zinc ribbon domain-containing protein [Bacteroidales bacterium]